MERPKVSQKSEPLHGMFTEVPPSYDLVNRLVSLGMDKRWRRLAAAARWRTCGNYCPGLQLAYAGTSTTKGGKGRAREESEVY